MTTSAPANLDDPPEDAPRFLRAFWRLVRWALPAQFRFFGLYEYRIAQVYYSPGPSPPVSLVLDLQATADTIAVGLDDIPKVPAWPGVAGSLPNPVAGSRVLVQFINGSAGRPVVVAWASAGDSGWIPVALALAGGGPAAARVGDTCGQFLWDRATLLLYYAPNATAAYVLVTPNPATPSAPPPATPGTPVAIATGSSIVSIG